MPLAPLRKGGLIARLSFCLLPCLALCGGASFAQGDPVEAALDADYGRQLLPGPEAPRPAVGALPGFAPDPADTGAAPRLAAGLSLMQRDLIRRNAAFSLADRRTQGAFDFTLGALPGLELRFAADGQRRELGMGDTATAVDLGDDDWGWRAAASIPVSAWIIPSVIVGGRSSAPDGNALTALAFCGSTPIGLEWSLDLGRRRLDYPVTLKLRDYRPLSLPFLLRQDFQDLGLGYARGPWQAAWTGRWIQAGPPRTRPPGYSLQDSAALWRQEFRFAYDRLRQGSGFRAALDFDLASGDHVFQGLARKGANLYPFSWQEGR